jgi:hypothetical protein
MKYIYGIQCHRITNPLRFLLSVLCNNPDSIVLVHVDQKADLNPFINEFSHYLQLYFIQDRVNVLWGHFSQIEATFTLLKAAETYNYSYFTLLSGDDIPLQNINLFHHYLENNPYEYLDLEDNLNYKLEPRVRYQYSQHFFKKHRTRKEYLICKWHRKLFKLGFKRNDISHIPKLYKGSQWFTLSHTAIQCIQKYLNEHPQYIETFKTSLCGDELFFHTILFNSELKDSIKTTREVSKSYLRYIDWHTGPDFPRTLNQQDFSKMQSSMMFFARKLESDIDLKLLEQYFNQ